ncbi:DNA translocase FtsK [Peptococcaceae bacterium]|nr:DNA translocase FtsK [Peptococcaceae bacterium]
MNFFKKTELRYEVLGIVLLVLALLSFISFYTDSLGFVGSFIGRVLKGICGEGRIIIPIAFSIWGIRLIIKRKTSVSTTQVFGSLLLFIIILTLLHLPYPMEQIFDVGYEGLGGGLAGALFSYLLQKAFGKIGAYIILTAAFLISILLITNKSLIVLCKSIFLYIKNLAVNIKDLIMNFLFTECEANDDNKTKDKKDKAVHKSEAEYNNKFQREIAATILIDECITDDVSKENLDFNKAAVEEVTGEIPSIDKYAEKQDKNMDNKQLVLNGTCYKFPPVSLLLPCERDKNSSKGIQEIASQIDRLERTMKSFGIDVKVLQALRGPAVTKFEVQPPVGVKVSRILNLANDIALSMAVSDVRIEAPIPGKSVIGIEVPNKKIYTVRFRCLLESKEFVQAKSCLTIALGQDISGKSVVADLAKMPHLLIAGATGSGKSVFLNTLICSLLFKAAPHEVKLLMIDPKMVELAAYNGIPHLAYPVVTDPKKATAALRWAVREMEKRYNLFSSAGVRDIKKYNNLFKAQNEIKGQQLPFIVIIIDELADLMMVAPADVEDAICRLAQMARAAGIHLVIATQRPSVDVITGLIKANIPSRISFAVSSQVDSRTILDVPGAEKLLGRGDMLFYPVGAQKPIRVQSAYLSDKEVEKLVEFLSNQAKPSYNEEIVVDSVEKEKDVELEDELLPKAVQIVIEQGQASISMLQRRLRIGYSRAARLIDIMEHRGIIGSYEGSKPRPVLITMEQFNQLFKENVNDEN